MRRVVGAEMGVKAAGGVRDLEGMKAMIAAGATRVGASAGVKIVQQSRGEKTSAAPAAIRGYRSRCFALAARLVSRPRENRRSDAHSIILESCRLHSRMSSPRSSRSA